MLSLKPHETFKYQPLLAKGCSETEVYLKHEHRRLGMTANTFFFGIRSLRHPLHRIAKQAKSSQDNISTEAMCTTSFLIFDDTCLTLSSSLGPFAARSAPKRRENASRKKEQSCQKNCFAALSLESGAICGEKCSTPQENGSRQIEPKNA